MFNFLLNKLHGYTVHQQCWTLLLPTDAHNVKKNNSVFFNIMYISW